jgi:hypothetical protein
MFSLARRAPVHHCLHLPKRSTGFQFSATLSRVSASARAWLDNVNATMSCQDYELSANTDAGKQAVQSRPY